MRFCLFLFAWCLSGVAWAGGAEVGKPFPAYTLEDAFGKTNTLQKSTRFVLVASEKSVSQKLNAWLATKGTNYLAERRAEYVSDITSMPGFVTEMFARPKMQKLPFTILLARDPEFAKTYPHQAGKLALFVLDAEGIVRDIGWHESPADVGERLDAGAALSERR